MVMAYKPNYDGHYDQSKIICCGKIVVYLSQKLVKQLLVQASCNAHMIEPPSYM